jgi:hypothetical protein
VLFLARRHPKNISNPWNEIKSNKSKVNNFFMLTNVMEMEASMLAKLKMQFLEIIMFDFDNFHVRLNWAAMLGLSYSVVLLIATYMVAMNKPKLAPLVLVGGMGLAKVLPTPMREEDYTE